MKTLLEYITFVKGIEYLIVVAFCFAFIALWMLVNTKEKEVLKMVSLFVPLSLIFGGAAVVVSSYDTTDVTYANTSEAALTDIAGNPAMIDLQDKDTWFRVNSSEYLSIKYEQATDFHKAMSGKVGCTTCHHNSGDEIHACKDCHGAPFNPHNASMPGLKAAYHQRCLSCHKEDFGSGPESCTKCHSGVIQTSSIISAPPRPHQLTWETCTRCHQNGIPGGQVSRIVYHDSCLKCHAKGIGGAAIVPEDHAGRAGNTCQGCHKPIGG